MLEVDCEGSPYEIGLQHGQAAREQIGRCIVFYTKLFREFVKKDWPYACDIALKFVPYLEQKWGPYLDEMKGVAEGSEIDFPSILALNVRTEIAYGLFNDGCTALSWKAGDNSFLAQNWDWQHEQKENLVALRISQYPKPTIHMITEAGIIGKIGINSAGVGVCLNAIRAPGIDFSRLPVHLSLRAALDSQTRDEASGKFKEAGIASACHILLADPTGGVGLECTSVDIVPLDMEDGKVFHTNHFVLDHNGVKDTIYLQDSAFRLERIKELVINDIRRGLNPSMENIGTLFKDEKNYPEAICRAETKNSTEATLFNIVMDLNSRTAKVIIGRPTAPEGFVTLNPKRDPGGGA